MLTTLFFWLFHRHKWIDTNEAPITGLDQDGTMARVGTAFFQKCNECSKRRMIQVVT